MLEEDFQKLPKAVQAELKHGTGIASEHTYRVPRTLLDQIHNLRLSVPALRLLHGILLETCRDVSDWYKGGAEQPCEGYRRRCSDMRKCLGIQLAKGNRDLARGIDELREAGLFEDIGFLHGNRWLTWRFWDDIFSALFSDDDYALLDARALHALASALDYLVYTELMMVRRSRAPKAVFCLASLEKLITGPAPWHTRREIFLRAIQKSAILHDLTFILLLRAEGFFPGIDTIEIRMLTERSQWRRPALEKCVRGTEKIIIVDACGYVDLLRTELPTAVTILQEAQRSVVRAFPGRVRRFSP